MRICVIIPSFYPAVLYGGWVFSSLNTCRELARLGIKSFVSTTNDNGKTYLKASYSDYTKLEENIFVKYYPQTFRERFSIKMFYLLWKDIKKADIVHIQGIFSSSSPIGLFYSFFFRKKVLLSPHGCLGNWCLADGSRLKKPYLFFFIKPFANTVWWHATSEQEMKEIKTLFPQAKIEIIPNGIYIDDFKHINKFDKSEFVKKYTGRSLYTEQIIISMSRLHRKKGLDILIRSFYKSLEYFPHALLLIAGEDFGEKRNLEDIINFLQLKDKVHFIGHIQDQDKIDFLGNADIFVLPSHNENFGMVFAEAMAAGTPVIASRNTPWGEVEDLKIGKWVLNDDDSIANAIIDLLKVDYKNMGENSKRFISTRYSWESIGQKFKNLFQKMKSE
jgi:glycosyltransferase involved in cell wall biosynthesis